MGDQTAVVGPYVPRIVTQRLLHGVVPGSLELDASVVFVDISGFTKLSERLARQGREGAEHLAAAIGDCFESLLEVAYDNGAGLLKFGGDALLLLFTDSDHTWRAVRSAAGMRRRLRESGSIDAGGATVRLRMSVGVHTGSFDLFLVGSSHYELIATGPAFSQAVRMESAANAGEIMISKAVAEVVGSTHTGDPRAGGHLLRRAPSAPPYAPDEPEDVSPPDQVARCLSPFVREHVLGGSLAPEHRIANVAFLHVDGTDALIADMGHQAATLAVHQMVHCVQQAADDHQVCFLGSDVDVDGAKMILTTGAPIAQDDDEERLLLALRRIVESPLPLPIRIGVNRGPVFAGDIGPRYRRTYTVMGDTVNLAARLMAAAPPSEIFASAEVLDRSQTRFAVTKLKPMRVKGKAAPVQAWAVGAVTGSRRRELAVASASALIGREREVREVEQALADARAGQTRLLEITGEPGIGKNRLMEHVRRQAADIRVIEAGCDAYTTATPYALWHEILRALLGTRPDDPEGVVRRQLYGAVESAAPDLLPWLALLGIPLDLEIEPSPEVQQLSSEFRTARLHDTVIGFLRGRMGSATLIEIHDAHLMDSASADLLNAVTEQVDDTPWIFVVGRRDVEQGFHAPKRANTVSLTLRPLDRAATLALAEALTEDSPIPQHILQQAVERSGGSPQFLRDLLRSAAAGATELPDSIESAAAARIDRLAPRDRTLVRQAAVLGLSFEPEQLAEITTNDAALDPDTWARLERFFSIDQEGRVHFRRPTVREAAYGGLPFGTRRKLHHRAGELIERELGESADDAAGVLSLHFLHAREWERAWLYALTAAEGARERHALADASRLYARALEAGRHLALEPAEMAGVWQSLGDSRARTGEGRKAMDAYSAARRLIRGDVIGEARILHRQGDVEMSAGRIAPAARWLKRGLRLLEGSGGQDASALRAALLSKLGSVRQIQRRPGDAAELCREALTEAEAAGDDTAIAHACFILDWALWESGRGDEAVYSPRALDIYRSQHDLEQEGAVLNNLGMFAYYDGRWGEASRLYQEAATALDAAGNVDRAAIAIVNIGEVLSDQGHLEQAESELRRALRVGRSSVNPGLIAFAQALLGRAAARAGRFGEADALLESSIESSLSVQAVADADYARALLAESYAYARRSAEALETADALVLRDAIGGAPEPLVQRVRGLALAQLGEADRAMLAFSSAEESARRRSDTLELVLALAAICDLADGDEPARRKERDEIAALLGIVRLPPVPLGA